MIFSLYSWNEIYFMSWLINRNGTRWFFVGGLYENCESGGHDLRAERINAPLLEHRCGVVGIHNRTICIMQVYLCFYKKHGIVFHLFSRHFWHDSFRDMTLIIHPIIGCDESNKSNKWDIERIRSRLVNIKKYTDD